MDLYVSGRRLEGLTGHEAGRLLLEQLYLEKVGAPMPEIACTPMGKPYFVEGNWHFSISHTKKHAFCALCTCPVGLDGEELTRVVKPALAEKILSPGEKAQYDAAADKNTALLTFWVLKEAAGKLSGRGIGFKPNNTDFMLTDGRVRQIDGCLVAVLTEEEQDAF